MKMSDDEVAKLGLGSAGKRVAVDSSVAIFGAQHMHLGDDVRIDAFCVLTAGPGELRLGNNVHISAGAHIYAGAGVTMDDFSGISANTVVYSVSDNFTSGHMINPTVPDEYRNVERAPVVFDKHVQVGANSVVLPGVKLGFGATAGALTLVKDDVKPCDVVAGNPARVVAHRDRDLLESLEAKLRDTKGNG